MKQNPLSEPTFYILLALSNEPLHGYGIIKKVEEMSEGRMVLAAGTLYGVIENLKKNKWISPVEGEKGSKRKVYQITKEGYLALMEDYHRMKALFYVARNVLEKGEDEK